MLEMGRINWQDTFSNDWIETIVCGLCLGCSGYLCGRLNHWNGGENIIFTLIVSEVHPKRKKNNKHLRKVQLHYETSRLTLPHTNILSHGTGTHAYLFTKGTPSVK